TSADPVAECERALLAIGERLQPGPVVLAFANAEQMEVAEELAESTGRRQSRIGRLVATHLMARGVPTLRAEVIGAGQPGAVLAALRAWALAARGRTPVTEPPRHALDVLAYRCSAGRVQFGHCLLVQLQVRRTQVVLQVRHRGGARDRQYHR